MSRTTRNHQEASGYDHYFIGVADEEYGRDRKPAYCKPPKWFKRMKARIRRAQEMAAIREDREPPIFKKTDQWDWC